ncbi:MAG TPA: CAP domain-containing protein [Chitinophagaceae bacterium]|nr:CAP domain-containing protein [Chitinophagaceae bacterium]
MMKNRLFSVAALYILALTITVSSCSNSKPVAAKSAVAAPANRVSAKVAPGLEEQILELINRHRKTKGLPALQYNYVIATVAREHTMNMATKRVAFGHGGFSARSKYIRSKISGVMVVAENVAFGSMTAEEVVKGWLNSPPHKKNIEGNFRLTGIGVARDVKSTLYFTQIFAN